MIDDEYEDSIVRTPQGGNLSPLLANIMLNELDKEMEKWRLSFVRYADDCISMVGSEMSANRVMRNILRFIEEKLGLTDNYLLTLFNVYAKTINIYVKYIYLKLKYDIVSI